MKNTLITLAMIASLAVGSPASAQTADDYHPGVTKKFMLAAGAFFPKKDLDIKVLGSAPEEEIDFDKIFDLGDEETTFAGMFRWNFGKKWSFWFQGWQVTDEEGAVLTEDYSWEDIEFKKGTFALGGLDTRVARVFFGRNFSSHKLNHDYGIGAGFHWLELEVFLEGQVLTSIGDLEFRRESVDADIPLPNIGVWYHYSWSPKWMFSGRVDWLSASVGDYSGGLWNAQVGIDWAPWKHVGLGLFYTYFSLDVDIEKKSWTGSAESTQYGPLLTLTTHW